VTYFEDGSPCSYGPGRGHGADQAISIGWLDGEHAYPQGDVSQELVAALCELGRHSVNRTRGYHLCELCPRSADRSLTPTVAPCENAYTLGSAEIRVSGAGGETFAAPNLIAHYVAAHSYKPPDAFASAAIRATAALIQPAPTTR
jgi:hypothetical protein